VQQVDLLAIGAHPDDVELGCAGTMLVAKRLGKHTAILDLTRGELSTRGTLETRERETRAATAILGLDGRFNLGLPDGNISVTHENTSQLIKHIRQLKPTIMLIPSSNERHPDHEDASRLARRAAYYAGLAKIETVGDDGQAQQRHRPLLVLEYMQTYAFEAKIVVDVSEVFEDRMRAVGAYATQFGRSQTGEEIPSKEPQTFLTQEGYFEWIEARARYYGMMIGVKYGEPFWSKEPVGIRDVFTLVTRTVS
jgi:bacillithiol biosynthesis deacetylase BshB1